MLISCLSDCIECVYSGQLSLIMLYIKVVIVYRKSSSSVLIPDYRGHLKPGAELGVIWRPD